MKNYYLLIALLLLCFVQVNAQTFSSISSFQTAINNAQPGDTIKLANGTYTDNFILNVLPSGTATDYITIMAETGGAVKIRGEVGIYMKGHYTKLKGFDFEDATVNPGMPSSGGTEGTFIMVEGDYNVFEDLMFKNVELGVHAKQSLILMRSFSTHDTIRRCWFEKGTQFGHMVYGDITTTNNDKFVTVEHCYFKSDRPANEPNGNEAIRFGSGLKVGGLNGSCTIQYNLFDEVDGEKEIVTLKSSNNTFTHNTIRNSYGHINSRHYHNNTFTHNFFINDDPGSLIYGGCLNLWGEGHTVSNNYFHQIRPRTDDKGAINMMAGNGEDLEDLHEAVNNVQINNNIIHDVYPGNHGISFGARSASGRELPPTNVMVDCNFISTTDPEDQIGYLVGGVTGVSFTDNQIYTNGGSMVPSAQVTDPNLAEDAFGVYRVPVSNLATCLDAGPSGVPLYSEDVGPKWLNEPVLPVTLINFDAINDKNEVHLTWETSNEVNSNYFAIEKSVNGFDFTAVGRVTGSGNSELSQHYQFTDTDFSGLNPMLYYRLKQVDFDGQYAYSEIKAVLIDGAKPTGVEVYPNPTKNLVFVDGHEADLKLLKVYNELGQEVTSQISISNTSESTVVVNLSLLKSGHYYIKTKSSVNKVYKQ